MEVERVAVEIGLEVDFGRETAARTAERLAMLPQRPLSMPRRWCRPAPVTPALRGYMLAKKSAEIMPGDLECSYFACTGSEATEAALRLAKL